MRTIASIPCSQSNLSLDVHKIRQRHIDKDQVLAQHEFIPTLACRPTPTPISVNSCVVNGVRFVMYSRDERHTTKNSGICSPGGKDGEMYLMVIQLYRNPRSFPYLYVLKLGVPMLSNKVLIPIVRWTDVSMMFAIGATAVTGGDEIVPLTHLVQLVAGGCLGNRGKGTRKPNFGGRKAGRLHTYQETQNLGLKKITDLYGPVSIRFEWNDRETLMPLGDHVAHCANYLGELVRELPMHYPSWCQVPVEQKAGVLAKIGAQFDLKPHIESERWPKIYTGVQQHLQKIYNGNKSALKAQHWVQNLETETYDVESIRRGYEQLRFSRLPVADPDLLPDTTVGGEEMLRLQGLGSNIETGVPYTEDEIMAIVQKGNGGCGDDESGDDEDGNEDEDVDS
ncbi:hypothetical protein Tco_0856517 [Tanacetum coccineum]|uniref:Uncharacterized protein n=1 Tax=Tanacetum coccineum TaxID=301880 RepID=A0ABQ5B415_9ASTR